jgi:hypothetical protein
VLPRVLTLAGARQLGISEARIRTELAHERWRRLATGIFLTRPDVPSRGDWIHVGMVLGGPRAALSGWDAVRLRGIGSRQPPDPCVLILTRAGRNRNVGGVHLRPSGRPLRHTTFSPVDDQLADVRIATTARAICDTALSYRFLDPVRAMVTAAIQRELCAVDELVAELERGPRNGSGLLRRSLADLLAGARSIAEAEAVELLRDGGVSGFLVNAPVTGPDGSIYVADLLWPQLRAIIEVDSREFHFSEDDWKATMARHNALTGLDYAVRHYPPSAVRSGGATWAAEVADWLSARARFLGVTWP